MRNLCSVILCGLLTVFVFSCNKEKEVPVTSVSLNQAAAEIVVGRTVQLSATVLPGDATDKSVSWASSNKSVATVSGSGKVTAVAEGISTITASAGGKSASCTVTVTKSYVAVTSVTLNMTELTLEKGRTETLTATISPTDATERTVSWSSSANEVASVDNNGKVTAVSGGNAVIMAKVGDKQATCQVTVNVPVQSISLNSQALQVLVGEQKQLEATILPQDASDKNVSWSSSNDNVATVENGLVSALATGDVVITATAGTVSANCEIQVVDDKDLILVVGTVPNDSPIIHAEGGSDVIAVEGPNSWEAIVEEGSEWCTVSRADEHEISIHTMENGTDQVRKALVSVTAYQQKEYIEVYQVPQIRSTRLEKTRRIRLSQKVTYENRSMSLIWITLPYVETNEYQTIENLQISDGGKVKYSRDGFLKYVSFEFRPTEKSGTVIGSIEYTAKTYYMSVDFSKVTRMFDYDTTTDEYKRFTGISEIDGNRYIDPENATLSVVADGFWEETGGNVIEYCRKCYDYVATAFTYQYGGNGIIADIIANGGGDCGNISNLFLSMVRHKGIPARPIVMTQPHNNNHVRTEFYLAGYGWIPVDPTYHMSGSDEFGKFTDNWVVSNRDEVFDWGIDDMSWKISILQACNWWWWCYSDGGDVTGEYDLSELTN